jgi:hypothetical protein
MAKRVATSASPTVPKKIKLTTWGSGETMYRVHELISIQPQLQRQCSLQSNQRLVRKRDSNFVCRDHAPRCIDGERLS